MSHAPSRLRRLLLPAWPPGSVAEALLLLTTAAAGRLLLELWFRPTGALAAALAPEAAATVIAGALVRAMAEGLLLALAVRGILRLGLAASLGAGALLVVATWAGPVVVLPLPVRPATLAVAAVALVLALIARPAGWRAVALAVAAAAVVEAAGRYEIAHAWALDVLDISVRGALVPGLVGARRAALDGMPLAVLALALWLALGGEPVRRSAGLALRRWGWPVLVPGAAAVAWGYVVAARGAWLPALLQPPAVYGPVAALVAAAALAHLAAGLQDRRVERPGFGEAGVMLAAAGLFGVIAGPWSPVALALLGLVLAAVAWMPVAGRVSLAGGLAAGAAAGLACWAAGALAAPVMTPERLGEAVLPLAAVAGCGAAFAGLAHLVRATAAGDRPPVRPRLLAALWLANLVVGAAAAAFAAGGSGLVAAILPAASALALLALLAAGHGLRGGAAMLRVVATGSAALVLLAAVLLAPGGR